MQYSRDIIICDIDDTIVAVSKNFQYENWDLYYANNEIKPIQNIIDMIKEYSIDTEIIFLTGRSDSKSNRYQTIKLLESAFPDCKFRTYYRVAVYDEYSSCLDSKRWLIHLFNIRYNIKLFIDDSEEIIKFCNELNIPTYKVDNHAY